MKTRFIFIAMLLFIAPISRGQAATKENLGGQQAGDLLKTLSKKLADTSRADILLRLIDYNLEKQGYDEKDLDSAARFIRNVKDLNSDRISRKSVGLILLYESTLTRKRGYADSARQFANLAIKQLQVFHDNFHLVKAYLELSRCYDPNLPDQADTIKTVFDTLFQVMSKHVRPEQLSVYLPELVHFYNVKMRADTYFLQLHFLDYLLNIYKILNDHVNEFWTRKEIADIHYKQGKLNSAIGELFQIAKEQKAGGYPDICFTYDLLSGLYHADGNFDKALYYSLETVRNVSTAKDSAYLSNFYWRVADNYSITNNEVDALDWHLKRLNYLISVNKAHIAFIAINDVTTSMVKLGRGKEALDMVLDKRKTFVPSGYFQKRGLLMSLARCYAAVKNYKMAEKYGEELIQLKELWVNQKVFPNDFSADQFLSTLYLAVGQYSKAEKYYKMTMGGIGSMRGYADALYENSFLFELDSSRGNYLSAVKHLQDHQRVKDSLFTVSKTKQIEELKISYSTEQKDQLINFKEQNIQLLTKQDHLQKSQLQQGALLRNIGFAVVVLLITIMALLYNRYRLKQRTNRKLELQQGEISKQNFTLRHLVDEKDWLVKEIHHRVKNNLQIVMSLLNSQSAYIENDAALTAIHDSQHRVHAMSLIHQKLYNAENVSSIDMSFYIRELTSYLSDSFNAGQRIRFEFTIEPLDMDVSQAVPLGLILNEAITNSLKYAFPDGRNGLIAISLSHSAPDRCLLIISDNGIGMPANFTTKKTSSLGMSLMEGLSEDLEGSFSIEDNNGTIIRISFIYDLNSNRLDRSASTFISSN